MELGFEKMGLDFLFLGIGLGDWELGFEEWGWIRGKYGVRV